MSSDDPYFPQELASERRFTAPSLLCPLPENWHSTDSDSTELEVSEFIGGLVRVLQPALCVEAGAAWGQTTREIGLALTRNSHGQCVALEIDPFRAGYAAGRCHGLPVKVVVQSSMDYNPTGQVDLLFSDSAFHLRVPEFERYRPFMRRGSIACFHDTAPLHGAGAHFPDGKDLHGKIAELRDVNLLRLPTPRGITLLEVL